MTAAEPRLHHLLAVAGARLVLAAVAVAAVAAPAVVATAGAPSTSEQEEDKCVITIWDIPVPTICEHMCNNTTFPQYDIDDNTMVLSRYIL